MGKRPKSTAMKKNGVLLCLCCCMMSVAAGAETPIEPHPGQGISIPGTPTALSSPQAVYLDWPANPEYNVIGYNIYRTLTLETGVPLETPQRLNSTPLESIEYNDRTVEKDMFYVYQVEALTEDGRHSALSAPSLPVKGQWVRVFFPTVSFGGLFLWELTQTSETMVRIPVAVDCAYDIDMSASMIQAELPASLLGHESSLVLRTGITERMAADYNIVPDESRDILHVTIAAASADPQLLYGAGELFHIYAQPREDAEAECGSLHLIPDSLDTHGVRLYDGDLNLISLDLEDGLLCAFPGDCLHGDVNMDGVVNHADAQYILDHIAGLESAAPNDCYLSAWDMNLDGRITTQDATLILRYAEGLPINPPSHKSCSLESFAAAALSMEKNVDSGPEIWIESLVLEADSITATVSIEGAAPLAGFSVSIAYAATELLYLDAMHGAALSPDTYLMAAGNELYGADGENGVVTVAVTGTEAVGKSSVSELLRLSFIPLSDDIGELPFKITSFIMNDPYSHAPRHTDPMAPDVVKSLALPASIFCTVRNANNEAPVTHATVTLNPGNMSVSANTNGVYTLATVPAGYYMLSVAASGFMPHAQAVIVNNSEMLAPTVSLYPDTTIEGEGEQEGEGEDEGEGEAPAPNGKERRILFCGGRPGQTGYSGDLVLLALLFAHMIVCTRHASRRTY